MNYQHKRPLGITLLALLFLWIGCFGTLFFPIMIILGGVGQLWDTLTSTLIYSHALNLVGLWLFSLTWFSAYVLYAFIGFGLWKLHKWALRAIVIVQWLGIIGALIAVIGVAQFQAALAISVGVGTIAPFGGILWYLSRPHVRYAFEPEVGSSDVPVVYEPPSTSELPTPSPSGRLWGKLTIAAIVCIVLIAVFVGGLFYSVEKMFRSSGIYKIAMSRAQNSPCIISKLGNPVSAKGMISGNLSEGSTNGSTDMEIPIHGPHGEGELDVSATKTASWTITSLSLIHDEGQIHILPVPSPCQ
jgi:hypothetical protein